LYAPGVNTATVGAFLALGSDAAQVLQQHVGVVLDRTYRARGEQFRKQAHHHPAILEHVGNAGRHAQVVLQHVVLACTGAHQVNACDVRVNAAGNVHAGHLAPILRVAQHPFRRNGAGLEYLLVVIDVGEEKIERAHALLQPGLENAPLVRRNDARNDVERNQALGSSVFAIHGKGDSDAMECAFGLVPFLCNARTIGALEASRRMPGNGPDYAGRDGHFIKRVGGHAIVSVMSD
jgi:hypothetical protein